MKMHLDEVDTDVELVRRLLAAQFPLWMNLPIEAFASAGTDHALYRLGVDMVVRLPRIESAAAQVDKEQRWLPRLAPLLPLATPVPLVKGAPGEGYPWNWSVYRWLPGEPIAVDRLADACQVAEDLAQFIAALQRIDSTGGPFPGEHNSFRGEPLATRDMETRAAIIALGDVIDASAAGAAWEAALRAPVWSGNPVWIHGDLQAGNLLARDGRLSAVIDFGLLGVGDPACDAMAAWTLFSGASRSAFRAALRVDEATWARGRGWALSFGLIALPYYQSTNLSLAAIARRTVAEVLVEQAQIG